MTRYYNTAEGGTNGTAVSTGNSGGASGTAFSAVSAGSGGTIAYSNSSPLTGALSILCTPGSGAANYVVWTLPTTATTQCAFRMHLNLTGYPSSATNWIDVGHATTGTSVKINLDTNGVLKVLTGSANTYRGDVSAAIPLDTPVRVEVGVTIGASGSVAVKVYNKATSALIGSYTSGTVDTNTQVNRVIPGKFTASGTMAAYKLDDFAFDDSSNAEIGPANTAPTANAGPDQTVTAGTLVTLDGTGSTDSDGTIASYAWTQTSGTAVTLSSTTAAQPTFTPATAGTRVFGLTVTDNLGATSSQDTVQITVNAGDTANAGPDQTVAAWDQVTLTGTGSATGAWSQVSGPAVTLGGSGATRAFEAAPSNTPGATVARVFRYTVGAATDDMQVTTASATLFFGSAAAPKAARVSF